MISDTVKYRRIHGDADLIVFRKNERGTVFSRENAEVFYVTVEKKGWHFCRSLITKYKKRLSYKKVW